MKTLHQNLLLRLQNLTSGELVQNFSGLDPELGGLFISPLDDFSKFHWDGIVPKKLLSDIEKLISKVKDPRVGLIRSTKGSTLFLVTGEGNNLFTTPKEDKILEDGLKDILGSDYKILSGSPSLEDTKNSSNEGVPISINFPVKHKVSATQVREVISNMELNLKYSEVGNSGFYNGVVSNDDLQKLRNVTWTSEVSVLD